jgi:hypothetical protein
MEWKKGELSACKTKSFYVGILVPFMETIFEYIIPLQLSVCKVKGQFMRYLLIFVFNFILIPRIIGQTSIEVLDSKVSPKGDIELEYADNDS